jgi:hydrogenase small subunit
VYNDPALAEMHVIWITAGLGCDGDTIAMTAATNPSIEDLVLGALTGIPMVRLHNPVLAYEVGDDFIGIMRRAAAGELSPFILVVEGSIPNEQNKAEGYWAVSRSVADEPAGARDVLTDGRSARSSASSTSSANRCRTIAALSCSRVPLK